MACVYWDSYKLEKKHECAGGNISPISCKCSLESSPDTSLKNTDHLCFPSLQTSDMWTKLESYTFSPKLLHFSSIPKEIMLTKNHILTLFIES